VRPEISTEASFGASPEGGVRLPAKNPFRSMKLGLMAANEIGIERSAGNCAGQLSRKRQWKLLPFSPQDHV
jgi:hypothetical protein